MHTKNPSVEMKLHPMLTKFLFALEEVFLDNGKALVITSGSEHAAKHGFTSLHYADPAQAVDVRTWEFDSEGEFLSTLESAKNAFCLGNAIPDNWIELIMESDHLHIEYQPKRPAYHA